MIRTTGAVGSEQSGRRPGIVVSNNLANQHSPVVEVVFLTTAHKGRLPTHVKIDSALGPSISLCEQITSVDKSRFGDYIGCLTESEMASVESALAISIGLPAKTVENVVPMEIKTPFCNVAVQVTEEKAKEFQQLICSQSASVDCVSGLEEKADAPQETKDAHDEAPDKKPAQKRSYTGAFAIQCESCGALKTFFSRKPTSTNLCRCGHKTTFATNIKHASFCCECGNVVNYRTNIPNQDQQIPCFKCGKLSAIHISE